ncbi:MAG: ATP-binding protein [Gammaproteobacteria bacterium]|nr:ATP-binding protein [Gammaproteobacteria bacterium]
MTAKGKRTGWSLRLRVLLAGAVVVALFAGLTGLAIERSFRGSVEELSRERLLARIYMLMSAADVDADGILTMPFGLPEPKLAVPGSGSYAAIAMTDGETLWRSESSLGLEVAYPTVQDPGSSRLIETAPDDSDLLQTLAYPVIWELDGGAEKIFIFQAAESRAALDAEFTAFRNILWRWLGGGAVALLLMQAVVLIWSLAPVRRVAEEVREIETGSRDSLGGDYPQELQRLTTGLNALIDGREARLQRYRNTLSDLAHSLKTPLAVLRAGDAGEAGSAQNVAEQLDRMEQSIEYHVQRAAMSGRSPLAAPIEVRPAAVRVIESLKKIYHDKPLDIECDIAPHIVFAGDPGDLDELLGNLGDNACKWGRSLVRISAHNELDAEQRLHLILSVEDDGPGIPDELREAVLKRGVRADSRLPGQGIGLGVVRETVEELYGGSVQIDAGELGGTRVRLSI